MAEQRGGKDRWAWGKEGPGPVLAAPPGGDVMGPRLAARFVTRPSLAVCQPATLLDCTASLTGLTGLTGLTVCLSVMLSPHPGSGVVRMARARPCM
jgi:hypothetical protein